ncbi:hypothetical protein GOV05_04590 [Candidatus Woesearchaeota archaeon]|nr:hypothetical protein [Candidatus Woesearchaeota archaeon]
MINKKGQAANFPYFIMTVIIFGIILFFGITIYNGLGDGAKTYSVTRFQDNLKNDVNTVSDEYGSSISKTYDVPNEYHTICVFDYEKKQEILQSKNIQNRPIVADAINNTDVNVVLIGEDNTYNFYSMPKIRFDEWPYHVCKDVENGEIKINLDGRGSHATLPYTSKAEVTIENPSNLPQDTYLYSSDGVAFIKIEKQGSVSNLGLNQLSIKVQKSESIYETNEYLVDPPGLSFSKATFNIDIYNTNVGLTNQECNDNDFMYDLNGHIPLTLQNKDCTNGIITFILTKT